MTDLANLSHLARPGAGGGDPALTFRELRWIVETAIQEQPRSQQVRIGPSELGTNCTLCLGRKLAGIPETRDVAWLPFVGTAMHAQLDDVFTQFNAGTAGVRFLTETRVNVGQVDGQDITGSSDLYDLDTATVVDFKLVGKSTLTAAKSGPSATYRTQLHLYGRGFARRGLTPDRVAIWYLPRNEPTLANAVTWSEPYDEQVAVDALARADALAKAIRLAGPDTVLASLPAAPGCYSCSRYPRADGTMPPAPGHKPGNDLRGLIQAPSAVSAGSTNAA